MNATPIKKSSSGKIRHLPEMTAASLPALTSIRGKGLRWGALILLLTCGLFFTMNGAGLAQPDPCDALASRSPDYDNDTVSDSCDLDDDNDGITDCIENGPYTDILSSYFVLSGTAHQQNPSAKPGRATLTVNSPDQAGAVMSRGKIDFRSPFTIGFLAFLGYSDNGADGMAVVFHNDPKGSAAIGHARSALGAGGIRNGIALEIDTWNGSSENWDDGNRNNRWMDHTSIWDTDVMFPSVPAATDYLTTAIGHGNLEDRQWHIVKISWEPFTETLSYTLDGVNAGSYTHDGKTDFVTTFFGGASRVYFGITAATGGLSNTQLITLEEFFDVSIFTSDVKDYFALSGSAFQRNPIHYPELVRLTTNSQDQAGAVMSWGKIGFCHPFTLAFQVYLGNKDWNGSDGMAVVFHNDPRGSAAIGLPRSALGAGGIRNGIALEIDTWNSSSENWAEENRRSSWWMDHTAIWDTDVLFPGVPSATDYLTTAIGHGNLEDGQWHDVEVNWDPATRTLSYTLDGANAGSFTHSGTTDDFFAEYFGGARRVYFGITAATGGLSNLQYVNMAGLDTSLLIEGDLDSDGDGNPNQIDYDSDNDGISDLEESGADYATLDADRNSRIDGSAYTDADRDGLADVIEDTYGENNGIPPKNSDNDNLPDFRDAW